MDKRTKLFFCICLLPLAVTQFMGGVSILEWRLAERHNERDEELKEKTDGLKNITLSVAEYRAAQTREHEIRWQGRMLDAARVVPFKDSVQLFYVDDLEEDGLLAQIDSFFSVKHASGGLSHEWVKIGLLPYLVPVPESVDPNYCSFFKRLHFPPFYFTLPSPELPAALPPPRLPRGRA